VDLSIPVQINSDDVTAEVIDGELIAVHWETGTYYNIEGVGAEIWAHVEKGAQAGHIVEAITAAYDGSDEEIKWDVLRLLLQMREERLVVFGDPETAGDYSPQSSADRAESGAKKPYEPAVLQKYDDMSDLLTIDPIHGIDDAGWPVPASEDEQ
jgi:hypothetical protein